MRGGRRPYVSRVRTEAAAEKRQDVIEAAVRYLRETVSISSFSLETVARSAGVTRLTVYNQFGSRRGLLEAVFDHIARQGGLEKLWDALNNPDPWGGLDHLVEIFCTFWGAEPAHARLQDAGVLDPEFGRAVFERNERRRGSIRAVVRRIDRELSAKAERDSVDLIFALTSYPTYRSLSAGRQVGSVRKLLQAACRNAVRSSMIQG
jgi:AcrR family transcriptional regulator